MKYFLLAGDSIVQQTNSIMNKPDTTLPIMSNSRFEALSDGVFAIVMTLLVIEIKIPELSNASSAEIRQRMYENIPHFISFATSFLVIGVIWINHHVLFHFLKKVNRTSLILNLFLLMLIAFIPYSSALIGKYMHIKETVVFYGFTMVAVGLTYNVLWLYIARQYLMSDTSVSNSNINKITVWSLSYPASYFIATLTALINIYIALVLFVAIPVFFLFPSYVDKQLLLKAPQNDQK